MLLLPSFGLPELTPTAATRKVMIMPNAPSMGTRLQDQYDTSCAAGHCVPAEHSIDIPVHSSIITDARTEQHCRCTLAGNLSMH
jgi:hypothetical protein